MFLLALSSAFADPSTVEGLARAFDVDPAIELPFTTDQITFSCSDLGGRSYLTCEASAPAPTAETCRAVAVIILFDGMQKGAIFNADVRCPNNRLSIELNSTWANMTEYDANIGGSSIYSGSYTR